MFALRMKHEIDDSVWKIYIECIRSIVDFDELIMWSIFASLLVKCYIISKCYFQYFSSNQT